MTYGNSVERIDKLERHIDALERQRKDDRIMHVALRQRVQDLEDCGGQDRLNRRCDMQDRRIEALEARANPQVAQDIIDKQAAHIARIRELYEWTQAMSPLGAEYRVKLRELWPWLDNDTEESSDESG